MPPQKSAAMKNGCNCGGIKIERLTTGSHPMISPRPNPSRLTRPLSSKLDGFNTSYNTNLPTLTQIVEIKIHSDIATLGPAFESAQIPWIEHRFESKKNLSYYALGREHAYFTRTIRKSSIVVNLSNVLKLLYLTRTRKVSAVRARLALLEISHRRKCAGKIGTFSMTEFRRLSGSTRITDGEVLSLLKNPKIDCPAAVLEQMMGTLKQKNIDRPVWLPRRTVRYLASSGSRLEIASMLTLLIRRMVNGFRRARVSNRMIAELVGSTEKHVRVAMQSLQEKRLIIKNAQAERWSVNRYGSLYDFPEDLSIDPEGKGTPTRLPPKRAKKGFAMAAYGTVISLIASACTCTSPMQKGADHINKDPSLQLEPLASYGKTPPEPSDGRLPMTRSDCTAVGLERKRQLAAAALLRFDLGPQGIFWANCLTNVHSAGDGKEALEMQGLTKYERLRAKNPPYQKGDKAKGTK